MIDPEAKQLKAEAYLTHVRTLAMRITAKKEQIDYHKNLGALSGINYGDKVSVQPSRDAIDNMIINLDKLIQEFCTELVEYVDEQRMANRALSNLSRPEYAIALSKHYLMCKTWEQVCVDMNYSWQGMMTLRKKAVIELYEYIPEYWKSMTIPDAQPD